jgi:hypothetical protein
MSASDKLPDANTARQNNSNTASRFFAMRDGHTAMLSNVKQTADFP